MEQCVSVSCLVTEGGDVKWFLTAESGGVPADCGVDGQRCRYCAAGEAGVRLRRAYVVVQAEAALFLVEGLWSEVLVAALTAEAVRAVQALVPEHRCSPEEVVNAINLLERGSRSSGRGCGCSSTEVCRECQRVEALQRRFLCATVFTCVEPFGEKHWFGGVTDATEVVSRAGERWLQCPAEWTRLGFLHACLWASV